VYTVHNQHSPQEERWGEVTGYPDHAGLDARGGPDGRPAGNALHTVMVKRGTSVRLYAIYEPGTKRIRLTKDLTVETLKEFREHVRKEAGCLCKQYFGVE